jgi:peptidoglycan/LPS O-acetylase OafA/YrhL
VVVFAICEGPSRGERITALVVLGAILLVVLAVAALVLKFSRGERRYLVLVYLAAVLAGTIVMLTPGGLSDADAEYGTRFVVAVVVGAVCGIAALALRRRRWAAYVITGAAGGATFAAGAVGLLIAALAITGSCLD